MMTYLSCFFSKKEDAFLMCRLTVPDIFLMAFSQNEQARYPPFLM